MDELRAIIKYPGAKWRIADWIINAMPEHKSYVEPYFGSGAVFFRKSASRIETINDIDDDVVNLFRCIRDDADALCRAVALTPFSRAEYNASFSKSDEPIEKARLFLVRHWQAHGSRSCYRCGWKNDVVGREYAYAAQYWHRLPAWIADIVERLKMAQIEQMPAVELIRRCNAPEVLIYADPPYLLSTRKGKKQYPYEMTEDDHVELLEALRQHQGTVMLSGYDNELYNDLLGGWGKIQMPARATGNKPRMETLWTNYDVQISLLDIEHDIALGL